MELRGSAAIVTGGTGGLGRRVCLALTRSGASVVVCYQHRKSEAEAVAREARAQGGQAIPFSVNIASADSVDRLVSKAVRTFGRIDILVNDAAYNKWIPFPKLADLSLTDWNRILATNLTGAFLCIKAVAPVMRSQQCGRMINISSVAGYYPAGSSIAYAVSKAGLNQLTRCMAVALAPEILVNGVAPGFMEGTRASKNLTSEYRDRATMGALLQRATDKDDVATLIVELCRTNSVTGQTVIIDAGRVFQ